MFERIKKAIENDSEKCHRPLAEDIDLNDDFRRLNDRIIKLSAEVRRLVTIDIDNARIKNIELKEIKKLYDVFVHTNSYHFMKNQLWANFL